MQEQITQLQNQINDLQQKINSLQNNSTMPLEFGTAMSERLSNDYAGTEKFDNSSATITNNSKIITAFGQSAAGVMDGLITVRVKGKTYNVPYYNL